MAAAGSRYGFDCDLSSQGTSQDKYLANWRRNRRNGPWDGDQAAMTATCEVSIRVRPQTAFPYAIYTVDTTGRHRLVSKLGGLDRRRGDSTRGVWFPLDPGEMRCMPS